MADATEKRDHPPIIAVTAPSRRSGKGTITNVLIKEYGYTELMFAMPLKVMYIALAMYQGVPQELYPRILEGDLKEVGFRETAGLSLRSFAEGIGTDWGRNMVDPELWVKMAAAKIDRQLQLGYKLVLSDVRFENECDIARSRGGVVWSVTRPLANGGLVPTLSSEGHLRDYKFDADMLNFLTVADLEARVRHEMEQYEG